MSVERKRRRLMKKKFAQYTPNELIAQVDKLTDSNKALHAMNLALVEVFNAAEALLEMRQDDPAYMSVRIALRERMDTAKELKAAIKEGKITTLNRQEKQKNGTDSTGQSPDKDNPTGA